MIQLQSSAAFQPGGVAPLNPPASRSPQPGIADIAAICLDQTAEALAFVRAASQAEIDRAADMVRAHHADDRPLDLMEAVARVQGHQEEHMGSIIRILGDKLAYVLNPSPPLVPFAGKLIAPSAFYESFDQLHKLSRMLLSPVIFAEDTDAIGTASANPIAATLFAEHIASTVFKRFGIRPFVTVARLDYESWTFLSRKHFEL